MPVEWIQLINCHQIIPYRYEDGQYLNTRHRDSVFTHTYIHTHTHTHTHTHMYACTHACTHTHTHTHTKAKPFGCRWSTCALLRYCELALANHPGAELVTHKRLYHVS